jgi:hypothetical protein
MNIYHKSIRIGSWAKFSMKNLSRLKIYTKQRPKKKNPHLQACSIRIQILDAPEVNHDHVLIHPSQKVLLVSWTYLLAICIQEVLKTSGGIGIRKDKGK